MSIITPFDPRSNFTMTHNYIIDVIMPSVKPNSFKLLMLIIRKTKGWGKEADKLSYSQLREGTGIKSDATLSTAIKELADLNYIIVESGSQWTPNQYMLNTTMEIVVNDEESPTTEIEPTSKTVELPTTENVELPTSKTVDTKENNTKEKLQKIVGSGSGSSFTRQSNPAYAEICTAVESNGFGMLTPFIADEIKSLMDDYPKDWILDAMKIATNQNKRKLSYAAGVLRRWRADGRDEKPKEQARPTGWQAFNNQDLPEYMREMLQ